MISFFLAELLPYYILSLYYTFFSSFLQCFLFFSSSYIFKNIFKKIFKKDFSNQKKYDTLYAVGYYWTGQGRSQFI